VGTAAILQRAWALLRIRDWLARECLAEVLAVFVLMARSGWAGGWWQALGVPGLPARPSPGLHHTRGVAWCCPEPVLVRYALHRRKGTGAAAWHPEHCTP